MTHVLRSKLPVYVVDHIKLYTGEGMWRNNKYIRIRRIPRDDFRYALLKNMSKIKQVPNDTYGHPKRGCVWFKRTNGNYTVITVRYTYLRLQPGVPSVPHYVWQMHHDKNCTTVIV